MSHARRLALLLVAAVTSACATAAPLFAGPALSADAQERLLLSRVKLHEDPALAEFLERVATALLTDGERAVRPPEIVVLRDPTLGAFVLPSGRIYVHTGLLARVENEAQLATLLARGLAQATRAADLEHRAVGGRVDEALLGIASTIGTALVSNDGAVALLSDSAATILGSRLTIPYVAAVTGYGAEIEREADHGALARMVRAGYDPKEAPRAFERLRREAKLGGAIERFFLGSDARLAERVDTLTRLVAAEYAVAAAASGAVATTDDFAAVMALVARDNARLELRSGRFRAAQEQLDRATAVRPMDALAHLYLGDLHRLRAQRARGAAERDELARRALAAYEHAATFEPALTEVARQIGLLYYQQGRFDQAREAFTRYLTRSPDAADAPQVREYIAALSR